MRGTLCCVISRNQANIGRLLKMINWFSCDCWRLKGVRHVWGRSVKCLGFNAGVSFARLTPPPAPYFSHSLAVSFPSRAFLETSARQAKFFKT